MCCYDSWFEENWCEEPRKEETALIEAIKENVKQYIKQEMERLRKEQKTQTNADKIRSMTDESLGKWICSIMSSDCCRWTCPARNMRGLNDNGLVKWLKQSARED